MGPTTVWGQGQGLRLQPCLGFAYCSFFCRKAVRLQSQRLGHVSRTPFSRIMFWGLWSTHFAQQMGETECGSLSIYIYTHMQVYVCMYVCMYVYIHTYMSVCIFLFICVHVYYHKYMCIHTHITCTCTYTNSKLQKHPQ